MTDLRTDAVGRRGFLAGGAALAGAAATIGFQALGALPAGAKPRTGDGGYGPLFPARDQTTGEELIALPRGFEYLTFGRTGDVMDDGVATPASHDGMAAFRHGDAVHLVRNHERGTGPAFASGMTYDVARGAGGTTTLVFDPDAAALVASYASLAGTVRNCAGGPTPWGSWLSCEETTTVENGVRHGYVFDVPSDGTSDGVPLTGLGRYSHEAAAVDPATGYVYLTEDATPSGLYRFVPATPGDLTAGTLQMLKIGDAAYQTYSDSGPRDYGTVTWVDIAEPDPAPGEMATVFQGIAQGGASFERGEGIWHGNERVYFLSTSGGPSRGQVFELDPAADQLRLIFHSPSLDVLDSPDNICVSPRGGLVLCEDGSGQEFLHGLTPDGSIFKFAENLMNGSEWAGATFEPKNGSWLFVNIQSPGITFAITGPWRLGAL